MSTLRELEIQLFEKLDADNSQEAGLVILETLQGATLESAQALDKAPNQNWKLAAQHFYTVFQTADFPLSDRAEGLTGTAQMLINLNIIPEAQMLLQGGGVLLQQMTGDEKIIAETDINIKFAWIQDLLGNFENQEVLLTSAKESLTLVDNPKARELVQTVNHFLARAKIGLASKDVDTDTNLADAEKLLIADMKGHLNSSSVQAFDNLWLARIDIARDDLDKAELKIKGAYQMFPGVEGHYHLMMGRVALERNQIEAAGQQFIDAAKYSAKVGYEKGVGDATFLSAVCEQAKGNNELAHSLLTQALVSNPYLTTRGVI